MKRLTFSAILIFTICSAYSQKPSKKATEPFELTPETAHPKAKALLVEEFYWSPIEETAPFGSDDASDAFYNFRQWRVKHHKASPIIYLKQLIENWGYPPFDWEELDSAKIRQYITAKREKKDTELDENMAAILSHFNSMSDSSGKTITEAQIKEILNSAPADMSVHYLLGQDNAIIAVGFGQFALEGKIDEDIKHLTKTAITRQLLPILINSWPDDYINTRNEQLSKMLAVIDLMNK